MVDWDPVAAEPSRRATEVSLLCANCFRMERVDVADLNMVSSKSKAPALVPSNMIILSAIHAASGSAFSSSNWWWCT